MGHVYAPKPVKSACTGGENRDRLLGACAAAVRARLRDGVIGWQQPSKQASFAVVCDHVSTIVTNRLVEGRKLVAADQDHGSWPVCLILVMWSGGPLRFERIRKRANRKIHRQCQISVDNLIEVNGDGRSLLASIRFGV